MEHLVIFLTGFVSVFAAAFQSRCVNGGHYKLAAGNAFLIGFSNAFLWTKIIADHTFMGAFVFSLSGALAVMAAMFSHERFVNGSRKQ